MQFNSEGLKGSRCLIYGVQREKDLNSPKGGKVRDDEGL